MAKRHIYSFSDSVKNSPRKSTFAGKDWVPPAAEVPPTLRESLYSFAYGAKYFFWNVYNAIGSNYTCMAMVIVIVLLSFMLPDISQKLQVSKDIESMKKVLVEMSEEVNRAEAACFTVAEEVCNLHYSVRDGSTDTSLDPRYLSGCTSSNLRNTQSEPVQVDRKIGFFRRIFLPNQLTSHKEIALMSYVYTHSFDAQKPVNVSTEL